jgi:hypothetical protein
LRFCMVDMVRWVFADDVGEINGRGGRRRCVYDQWEGRDEEQRRQSRRMRIAGRGGSEVELGVSGWSKVSEVRSLMITKSEEVEMVERHWEK